MVLDGQESPNEVMGRLRFGAIHGLLLFLFMGLLRVMELALSEGELTASLLIVRLVPVASLVLVLEVLLLLLARIPSRWLGRSWTWISVILHGSCYLLSVIEHRYFLSTGTRLDPELALYSIKHGSSLGGLLSTGLDYDLVWNAALGALCFILGIRWSLRRSKGEARWGIALEGGLLALGLAVIPGWTESSGNSNQGLLQQMLGAELASVMSAQGENFLYESPSLRPPTGPLPNILLVILESTRFDVVGAYQDGGRSVSSDTPALDRLASSGLVVEEAYTTVPHTSKALVGILCGGFPRLQTEIGEAVDGGLALDCLPKLLARVGYRTRFIQSATAHFENRPVLLRNMGFDSWLAREDLDTERFEAVGYFGLDERALIEPAVSWAKEGDAPFLLSILTSVSHHPYHLPGEPEPEGLEIQYENYLRSVHHTDEAIGELIEQIRREHPDTVVVVVGDHGEGFGEHGVRGHNLVPYEEGIRVPWIIVGPTERIGEPRRITGLRQQIDILPTLLDLAGIPWVGSLTGSSVVSDPVGHDYIIASCWQSRRCLAMRLGNLKVIYRYRADETEVFNLTTDPGERTNLVSEYPSAMIRAIEKHMLEVQANVEQFYFLSDRRRSR